MVDLSRRKMVLGIGLLATGSGASFTSAAFSDETSPSSDFRVVAAGDLNVRRGTAFKNNSESYVISSYDPANPSGSEITDWSALNPDDLPVAWADDNENGSLSVQLAYQNKDNSASPDTLSNFLQISNDGTTTEEVGINYEGGYAFDGSEDWTASSSDFYNSGTDVIGKDDVQSIFKFQDNSDSTLVSPSSPDSAEDPANWIELTPGDTLDVDLTVTLDSDQVSTFASNAGGASPFSEGLVDFQLLSSITVGSKEQSSA
ncbi:hypothetical protein [Halobellus sp. GM3]|uniref:hypothetical protein n=1 Tax=Halobellus sp. GM3 TaxID=3458410 RepID=UPI00403DE110